MSIRLIAVAFLVTLRAFGQDVNYRPIDFYDNKDGLSQGTVNAIAQDKFGYLWFGTQDGLNKFDGVNFTAYKHDRDNPASISDNYINALLVGQSGDLWIGTRSNGLNRYNIEKGTFEYFRNQPNDSSTLSDNWVTSLAQDQEGNIWVGTSRGGLNKFNPTSGILESFQVSSNLAGNSINTLFIGSENILWIGTSTGLSFYDFDSKRFGIVPSVKNDVLSIANAPNHALWVGTNGQGLKLLNEKREVVESIYHDPKNKFSIPDNKVIALLQDNATLWVGTDGGGLASYDAITKSFTTVKVAYPRLKSLFSDQAGDIWVGVRGGLNKINIQNNRFQKFEFDKNDNLLAPNGDIHALTVDQDGFIWIGSSVDGLKKIDRETLQTTSYLPNNLPGSISSNRVSFLFIDSDENMWVGTYDGLNLFDPKTETFTVFKSSQTENSISDGRINIIYEDSVGFLWIGTENGLNRMDRKTQEFKVYKHSASDKNSIYSNNVSAIIEDDQGIFWVGYAARGFDRVDFKSMTFKHFSYKSDDAKTLSNDRVSHIYDDSKGNLWLSTYGGGLNKFDKNEETFTVYNETNGLANGSLYCAIPDEFGNLWMSHNEGISKFDPVKKEFKNYFQGEEFNSRAYFKAPNDEIFLGGFYIVSFLSKNISDNETIPPVLINEFVLLNEQITPASNPSILGKVIEEVDTLELAYDQNFFSFGFVSLNYTNPENNELRYRLSNFDNDWINATEYAHAYYTNVPAGEYLFKVQGSNNDGLWNEKGDSIYIIIQKPWWETWWFRMLCVSIILIFLIAAYRFRLKEIKRQNIELERLVSERTSEVLSQREEIVDQKESIAAQNQELIALNEEKNELIQIVAHDLRSPLNQIKGLASIIKLINPYLNKETTDSINLIEDLVERQRSMISKVLDTSAIDARQKSVQLVPVSLNEVINEVLSTLSVVADNKGIELIKQLLTEPITINGDRNYLIQIIENIVSNAIKFSPRKKDVIISLVKNNKKVQIRVEDHGPGINKQEMKFLFERYTKLSAKPTNNEESSGLGLSIAKRYMDVMNGKLWCESEEGKGATFIMEFNHISD